MRLPRKMKKKIPNGDFCHELNMSFADDVVNVIYSKKCPYLNSDNRCDIITK